MIVADGDSEVRRLLRVKLGAAGFDVREAASVAEIRTAARHGSPPDALVCEWRLADGDPVSLFADLATWGPQKPAIVILSELDGDDDIERALVAGGDDVVAKPFSPAELILRVRVALVRRAIARGRETESDLER